MVRTIAGALVKRGVEQCDVDIAGGGDEVDRVADAAEFDLECAGLKLVSISHLGQPGGPELYNTERPHEGIDGRAPNETWVGEIPAEPTPFRTASSVSSHIQVTRRSCRGDPCLPSIRVRVAA